MPKLSGMLIVRTVLFVVLGGYRAFLFVLKKIGNARMHLSSGIF
jgi:hypothetical protein